MDWIEVGIVEIAQEPEETGSEDLAQEKHERGEIEHVDHADEPVKEHGRPGRLFVGRQAVDERGVEETQRADVEPNAADERKHANLKND